MKECPCEGKDEGNKEEGEERAFQFSVLTFIEAFLTERNHLAEPHDGMWHPLWVTKKEVKKPTCQQGEYVGLRYHCY